MDACEKSAFRCCGLSFLRDARAFSIHELDVAVGLGVGRGEQVEAWNSKLDGLSTSVHMTPVVRRLLQNRHMGEDAT